MLSSVPGDHADGIQMVVQAIDELLSADHLVQRTRGKRDDLDVVATLATECGQEEDPAMRCIALLTAEES